MLSNEMKEQLIEKIKKEVNPTFIILFGSCAKGTARVESDIDIAYFSHKQLSSYERFILAGELALIVGREVDLVDIKQIDTVFTMQIFEQGVPIYIQDENEWIRQKMRAYSMYATLNEQRAPIIDEVFLEVNDIILNKITTIERCVNRIHEVYEGNPENLCDFTKQASI